MKISALLLRAAKDANAVLEHYGLDALLRGERVTLYHGTTHTFTKFDMTKSREDLVNSYYGVGLFFTPSKKVAWQYADANRNIGFDPEIVDELRAVNRNAGEFLALLVAKGSDAWDALFADLKKKYPNLEAAEAIIEHFGTVDPNTLDDLAGYVLGSKTSPLGADDETANIFHQRQGLPAYMYRSLDEIGLDSKKYRPKVYTVSVSAKKVLVTKSKSQARGARGKGYDAVIYYGPDLVSDVPEVATFDAARIQILHVEVGD